jgi:hypothetical protein
VKQQMHKRFSGLDEMKQWRAFGLIDGWWEASGNLDIKDSETRICKGLLFAIEKIE